MNPLFGLQSNVCSTVLMLIKKKPGCGHNPGAQFNAKSGPRRKVPHYKESFDIKK